MRLLSTILASLALIVGSVTTASAQSINIQTIQDTSNFEVLAEVDFQTYDIFGACPNSTTFSLTTNEGGINLQNLIITDQPTTFVLKPLVVQNVTSLVILCDVDGTVLNFSDYGFFPFVLIPALNLSASSTNNMTETNEAIILIGIMLSVLTTLYLANTLVKVTRS